MPFNPAARVDPPKLRQQEITQLDTEQARRFLQAATSEKFDQHRRKDQDPIRRPWQRLKVEFHGLAVRPVGVGVAGERGNREKPAVEGIQLRPMW